MFKIFCSLNKSYYICGKIRRFMAKLFIMMVLLHLVDDFWLQPTLLSKLKQKTFWSGYEKKYANDWVAGLICHGVEWSAMILLPLIFAGANDLFLCLAFLFNAVIHCVVDHVKCNALKINLITDQLIHFGQICLTFIVYLIW